MRLNQSWLHEAVVAASARARYQAERLAAEIAFAESLCELQPEKAEAWRPLVAGAGEVVQKAVQSGRLDLLDEAVTEAESVLSPLGEAAKSYTVHCVGHAHIDMNWAWPLSETAAVTNDTFDTVLRLMEEYPDFCFSQSQASVYSIVEQFNPALLERIAERVEEGRWEVTASHWVEGDKNMVGGEGLCRHLLYTRRYLQELFGLSAEDVNIDWAPDTFGHPVTVPTYLVRGGVKYLYLHRPGQHEPRKPRAFWWQGPDGSRVLVRNDAALGYSGQIRPHLGQLLVDFTKETGCRALMFVYGVGDHGGGPTRRDILCAIDMDNWPIFPNIRFSTARASYEALEQQGERVPTLDCELNTEFAGCYTSQSLIKKANRRAENRLADAEVASTLAWSLAVRDYPADGLREGWLDTLFCHFHDILPGSGVRDTRTYAHGLYQKTMATTSMAETQALRGLAARVDTSGAGGVATHDVPPAFVTNSLGAGAGYGSADGALSGAERTSGEGNRPFVVFNSNAWDRTEVVEVTVWDTAPDTLAGRPLGKRAFSVRLPDGKTIPAQSVGSGNYWGHQCVTLAFPASVAGLGYALHTVVEEASSEAEKGARQRGRSHRELYPAVPAAWSAGWLETYSPEGLENGLIRLDVDPHTGGIRSLLDKRSGAELIAAQNPASVLEYAVERPHNMSSWFRDYTGPVEHPRVVDLRRTLDGPYRAALKLELRIHDSELTLTYELRAGDPKLYLHLTGTWFERGTPDTGVPTLGLVLPLALKGARARYEIPFGAIDRDLNEGQEVPALQWAQVTGEAGGKRAGCLLLNDCKHGHSLDGSVLRLALIRSSYNPDPLPEIGTHEIHLALLPFAGEISVAEATRHGRDFNHALRVVGTDVHQGDLPPRAQFLSVEPENVIVSALKKAEDGEALVVRVYETAGRETTAVIKLNTDLLGEATDAEEVDLMERPVTDPTARAQGGTVSVRVPPRGIASVRWKLSK